MPSGKREAEKKGNTPVNTGPSPNSDGRANNLVEEADEPARGSGPLQYNLVVTCQNEVKCCLVFVLLFLTCMLEKEAA
ncbi:hypothetical protein T08_2924 [Trichinella sp. T8]|nr:hypothetical protein T08_2924 [Trichinella sp. T8]